MLVISQKKGEKLRIGRDITITILEASAKRPIPRLSSRKLRRLRIRQTPSKRLRPSLSHSPSLAFV